MNKKYQLISETISLQEDLRSATKTTISVAGITLFVVASIPSMGSAMIPWAAYKMIRAAFNDGQRRCRVFGINTKSRQTCLLKVKLEQLSIARKYVSDEKTKRKIEAKMVKIQNRIDKYTADLARKGKTPMEPLDWKMEKLLEGATGQERRNIKLQYKTELERLRNWYEQEYTKLRIRFKNQYR